MSAASGSDTCRSKIIEKNVWNSVLQLKTFNQYLLDPHHHRSVLPQLQLAKVAKIRDHQGALVFQETLDLSLQ
jgi:hypothetical protein